VKKTDVITGLVPVMTINRARATPSAFSLKRRALRIEMAGTKPGHDDYV
jgi:hypothetical protein